MLALYRCGRQADALAAYRRARTAMLDTLAIEPGPELRELEARILAQDPELGPATRRLPVPAARRRAGALITVAGGVLAAAAVAAVLAGGGENVAATPNSVVAIDPDNGDVVASVPVGVGPAEVSADGRYLWVANRIDNTVTQVDMDSRIVVSTTGTGTRVDGVGAAKGTIWISDNRRPAAVRLDPALRTVLRSVRVSARPSFAPSLSPIAVGGGAVWVATGNSTIARIDPATNRVVDVVEAGNNPSAIALGSGALWIVDEADNTLARIDPSASNAVSFVVPVGERPSAVTVGEGSVWVANANDATVSRIDPRTGSTLARIAVGAGPSGVAVGRGSVWVANGGDQTVSHIDARTNRVRRTIRLPAAPSGVAVARGHVWVSLQTPAAALPASPGGGRSLRILLGSDPGPLDPAVDIDLQRNYATCALLLNYPDLPAPRGSRLVPEAAAALPEVSDGGRKYTFTIRRDFRFSPPSNAPVTAQAFERAIERSLDPKLGSFASSIMGDLRDVRSRGDRLVVRLRAPSLTLPARLATSYFCAVPPGTPATPIDPLPTAGPYYVASHVRGKAIVLRRNPGYGGTRPRRFTEIHYTIGGSAATATREVIAGRADYVAGGQPGVGGPFPDDARLAGRYGPGSRTAVAGRQQYFETPGLSVLSLMLNMRRPLFADARMRRAVNFAIDRRALAAEPGINAKARPTDQYIPPGIPGFADVTVYPLGTPNVEAARRLAGARRRPAVLLTCTAPPCARHAQIITDNLAAIGIDVESRRVPLRQIFERITNPDEPFDIATFGYFADYADPFNFVNLLFGEGGLYTTATDRSFDSRMSAAAGRAGEARLAAYARLDADLARTIAPGAAYANGVTTHLFSARIGCQFRHPIHGIDLGTLCLRPQQ